MSLIVTLHVQEGFVLAADSRVSMHLGKKAENTVLTGIRHYSDNFQKVFELPNHGGISFCGEMATEQGGLHFLLGEFIRREISAATPLTNVPQLLLNYFQSLPTVPATIFHVCGYGGETGGGLFYRVIPKRMLIEDLAERALIWDGEGDILARILSPVEIKASSEQGKALPDYPVPLNLFTLQDAVDFADYAVKMTAETMKFQLRPKTVGGAVDILVLQPGESRWLRKKTLKLDDE